MSETSERDAVLEEFHEIHEYAIIAGLRRGSVYLNTDGMADEIVRLRAAIERVRAVAENELRFVDAQPILRALDGDA